jgi:transposase
MWTPTARQRYSRTGLRYASDLTDAEWALIAPLLPAACGRGRPRSWPLRAILDAIFYVLRGGIAWRLVPTDFPPWQTVYRWFATWRDAGLFATINHALVMADRERAGRAASPTAAVMDSQSVRTSESGGPRGYDAAKKVKGRKRHALVDTGGRALLLQVHAADVQDRDGAVPLLRASRGLFPWIERVFADAGYAADRVAAATRIVVEIVRKHPDQVGFAVHPRRRVVERFFAWLGRNRRLAKDVEATLASATAFLYAASVMLLIRRLARPT